MNEHDEREWAYLQSLGLKPEIDTLDKYLAASEEGLKRGQEWLAGMGSGPFTVQDLAELHKEVFRDIHPWAGALRAEEIIIDKRTGLKGSDPDKIVSDLETLNEDVVKFEWFDRPKEDVKGHAKGIAAYHIGLHLIHPFEDGNGRVMRLIMDHQMELTQKTLGIEAPERPEIAKEREKYLDACAEGVQHNKLEALSNLVLETAHLVEKAQEQEFDLAAERAQQEMKERERGR